VYAWEEHENPYEFFAKGLKDRGLSGATIGIEETVRFQFSDGAAHIPQVRTTSGTPITAGCRIVKDAHELALMRHASAVTLKAYEAAYKSLKEGMTQDDFEDLVQLAHKRLGYNGSAGVQVGKYSALPHGSATPQTVQEGSILLIDGGCKVEGYSSDISRTFVLGKATQRMKDVFEIEHRAQTAALRAARPGLPCEAVDAAARKVIVDAGFGPDYRVPGLPHRTGHGIGLDGHEWTNLVRGNRTRLAPGMCFSDEPTISIPGEFGIRLEDCFYVTEEGRGRMFTPPSPSFDDPFGNVQFA
jgi:Xaa-Pro dipeptidase